jgi:hypothetical protein
MLHILVFNKGDSSHECFKRATQIVGGEATQIVGGERIQSYKMECDSSYTYRS